MEVIDTMEDKSTTKKGKFKSSKALTTEQNKTAKFLVRDIKIGGGKIMIGGTGSGKTRTALWTAERFALDKWSGEGAFYTLCVVPSMGGLVLQQFKAEAEALGMADSVHIYHDVGRDKRLQEWKDEQDDEQDTRACFIITSIDTLHADVINVLTKREEQANERAGKKVKVKRKGVDGYAKDDVVDARRVATKNLGGLNFLIIDEFQVFALGTPQRDARVEVDPKQVKYNMLDAIVRFNSLQGMIGLSATPIQRSTMDIFPFIRLFENGGIDKESLLESTRLTDHSRFRKSTSHIARNLSVKLVSDVVPDSTRIEVTHSLSDQEAACHGVCYTYLNQAASNFIRATMNAAAHPTADQRSNIERAKRIFYSWLMRARRGACHPGLFNARPMTIAEQEYRKDLNVEDEEDEEYLRELMREAGLKFNHTQAELIEWRSQLKAMWPLQWCGKFNSIVERLKLIQGERTLIMFEHVDTVELLAMYMREALPERDVYVYHGGLAGNKRSQTFNDFKTASASNAIMISTRGALEMAVNVECTTVKTQIDVNGNSIQRRFACRIFFGDIPNTESEQKQAEGRCKRPKAQGHPHDEDRVMEWHIERFLSKEHVAPTIEDVMTKSLEIKAERCEDLMRELSELDNGSELGAASAPEPPKTSETLIKTILETLGFYGTPPKRKKRVREGEAGSSGQHAKKQAPAKA